MRNKDLQTILNGISLVAQAVVTTHGPVASRRLRQAYSHVSELARLAPTMFDQKIEAEAASTATDADWDAGTATHAAAAAAVDRARNAHGHASGRATPPAPGPQILPPPPKPKLPAFDDADAEQFESSPEFRERAVPAGSLARVLGFSQLAAGLAMGTVGEVLKRTVGMGSPDAASASVVMNEANAERLAETLCRMRGAALKVGQMLSIQDDTMLPPVWQHVLERVRQQANVMPQHQLQAVLSHELGDDWRSKFDEFEETPLAAASIGQVHHATLPSGEHVAVKVQYPGVAQSIDSDLDNVKRVLAVADVVPKGLYIENVIQVAREELHMECDYLIEAANQQRYRQFVMSDPLVRDSFVVPKVHRPLCTSQVLTSQLIPGVAIDKAKDLTQEQRNKLGRRLLHLTLQELFVYRFMQTDPNWGNFLYDERRDLIGLLDFGAARKFPKRFVDEYLRLVWAAANKDRETFEQVSLRMGLITGHESQAMLDAHVEAGMVVGEPFVSSEPYNFKVAHMAKKVQEHAQVFAEQRLTPPPKEIYSLHRRLSGAFFMCIHLGAEFQARDALELTWENHVWGTDEEEDDE